MVDLVYCELLKLKRSKMLLISFLGAGVTPLMMMADGIKLHFSNPEVIITLASLFHDCSLYTMLLFGLIVYAVIAAYLFSREHTERTLKTILTVPVSKLSFILSKFIMLFIWILVLTLISWTSMFALASIYQAVFGLAEFSIKVAMNYLGEMILGGMLLFLTISPLAFLAVWTKSLVAPIVTAAAIAMGNVALSNEALGALYPWTASYLLINGGMAQTGYPYPLAIGLIALVSVLGFLSSIIYFHKEDVK